MDPIFISIAYLLQSTSIMSPVLFPLFGSQQTQPLPCSIWQANPGSDSSKSKEGSDYSSLDMLRSVKFFLGHPKKSISSQTDGRRWTWWSKQIQKRM